MPPQLLSPTPHVKPKRLVGRPSSVRPQWTERERVEQLRRIRGYFEAYGMPMASEALADRARNECLKAREAAASEQARRSQVPSLFFFRALLGLFDLCARFAARDGTQGGGPIFFLQLSAEEIGDLLGWKRSTVFAGERWVADWIGSVPRLGMANVSQHRRGVTESFTVPVKRTSMRYLTVYALTQLELAHRAGPQLIALHLLAMDKATYAKQLALEFEAERESAAALPETTEQIAEAQAAILRMAAAMGPTEAEMLTQWRARPGEPPS